MQLHAKAEIYCISLFHGSICKVACKEFFDWPSWLTESKIFYLLVSAKTAICCIVSCSLSTLCALMYMQRYTTCMHACWYVSGNNSPYVKSTSQRLHQRTKNSHPQRCICAHTLTYTHTYSVGKKQWCIPAHISPAGDNCAISQRVAETLFIACCGGMGGGYELMSSERKTTSSHTLIQIPHEYTHTHIHAYKHTERQHSPISGLSLFSR